MQSDYLIVRRDVVSESIKKVVKVKDLIDRKHYNIFKACKEIDLSRATYYKYKDSVYELTGMNGKKAIFSIYGVCEPNVLPAIMQIFAQKGGTVLTIHQDMPIEKMVTISITVDFSSIMDTPAEICELIEKIDGVKKSSLLAFE